MSAAIIRPAAWDRRYELRVWLLNGTDFSGPAPATLKPVWEVARCPYHMDWVDSLIQFDEEQRDAAVAWAKAYAVDHPDHFFVGDGE